MKLGDKKKIVSLDLKYLMKVGQNAQLLTNKLDVEDLVFLLLQSMASDISITSAAVYNTMLRYIG